MVEEHRAGNKLAGVYRGKVLQHLANGFCKIMIYGVYPVEWESQPDLLPQAEQASPIFAGNLDGNGTYSYPNIGSTVWCMFANGDQNLPIYFATTHGGNPSKESWNCAYAMPGSHPQDAYVHKIHSKNSDIEINESGYIKVSTRSGENLCEFTLDQDGNVRVETTSTITFKTKRLLLDADTQIELKSPSVQINGERQVDISTKDLQVDADIHAKVKSNAIELDSASGGTLIKSATSTTLF